MKIPDPVKRREFGCAAVGVLAGAPAGEAGQVGEDLNWLRPVREGALGGTEFAVRFDAAAAS